MHAGPRNQVVTVLAMNLMALCFTAASAVAAEAPPKVGDKAADFELPAMAGGKVRLSKVTEPGPVVLIVLRGYPGYQCPICNRQVGEFLQQAEQFKAAGANVIFVYPGPAKDLELRAKEFYADKTIPDHFLLVTDPDYTFTNKYNLRWDAPRETAYPATFVIQKDQKITFANVS